MYNDLRVLIEDSLYLPVLTQSYWHYCGQATSHGRMSLLQTFTSRSTELMLIVLKSLIVSNVEYACIIWSPTDSCHIKLIEGVQCKFTSRFACFQTYDENLGMSVCTTQYHDRLKILKIYSLERQRERARYMIIYM